MPSPPPKTLGIDPGRCTGWAFLDNGQLTYCGVTDVDTGVDLWYLWGSTLVIEVPQVYRASLSKGDPNDLIKVAVEAGRWIERAHANQGHVYRVLPQEWKGQVPKKIHHARIVNALSDAEKARMPKLPQDKAHNMLDAIGLALYMVGRISRGAGGS